MADDAISNYNPNYPPTSGPGGEVQNTAFNIRQLGVQLKGDGPDGPFFAPHGYGLGENTVKILENNHQIGLDKAGFYGSYTNANGGLPLDNYTFIPMTIDANYGSVLAIGLASGNMYSVTKNNGVWSTWKLAGSNGNVTTFLSSGIYIATSTSVTIDIVAPGGGGSSKYGLGGGAGQAIASYIVSSLTIGQEIPITIGTAGLGGIGPVNSATADNTAYNGTDGGNSSFGSFITVYGGKGAISTSAYFYPGDCGGLGGQPGELPKVVFPSSGNTFDRQGGRGGNGLFGIGGEGGINAVTSSGYPTRPGGNGIGYGSGGGGGADSFVSGAYTAIAGGNGAPGMVRIRC